MNKGFIHTAINVAAAFYFMLVPAAVPAQVVCSNVTYLSVRNFGDGAGDSLPHGLTSLLYTANPCPTEGYYTLANGVTACFGNWRADPPNIAGNKMLINAAVTPGDFYIDTIRNLCGSSNYVFGANFGNVSLASSCGGHPIRPVLSFYIEDMTGAILGQYDAAPLIEVGGFQHRVYFSIGAGPADVVIRITNHAPGGCGNDFQMDDVAIAICGPQVEAGFTSFFGDRLDLCAGDNSSINLLAKLSPGYSHPAYQWQRFNGTAWENIFGATMPDYLRPPNPDTGTYRYRVFVAEAANISSGTCGITSNEVIINIRNPRSRGAATSNSPVCQNSTAHLTATGGISYLWTGPAGFASTDSIPAFIATAASAGQYTVMVTDAEGCKSTAATTVSLLPAPAIVVSDTKSICLGDSVALTASGGVAYSWQPAGSLSNAATNNPVAKPQLTTRYTVTVRGGNSCTDTAGVAVVINTRPVVSAGKDKVTIRGQAVTLEGSIKNPGNVTFGWAPSPSLTGNGLLNPKVNPAITTDYILTATSTMGCGTSADTVSVKVFPDFYVPTAFTPNGDGRNDAWQIPALQAFPNAVLSVYNRYGNKIFESVGGAVDWDGRYQGVRQLAGVYVYVIDLKNNRPVIKGTVLIIR